jgi:hypothetical protein
MAASSRRLIAEGGADNVRARGCSVATPHVGAVILSGAVPIREEAQADAMSGPSSRTQRFFFATAHTESRRNF